MSKEMMIQEIANAMEKKMSQAEFVLDMVHTANGIRWSCHPECFWIEGESLSNGMCVEAWWDATPNRVVEAGITLLDGDDFERFEGEAEVVNILNERLKCASVL